MKLFISQKMQSLRFKFAEPYNRLDPQWRYCFCFHVRTGTIFYGVWHALLHVVALSLMLTLTFSPQIKLENHEDVRIQLDTEGDILPTPLSEVDPMMNENSESVARLSSYVNYMLRNRACESNVGIFITTATLILSLTMIYGTVKGKPACLMPFFCLQVCDFFIESTVALAYICYLPDVRELLAVDPDFPYQKTLMSINPQCLALLILLSFMIVMMIKGYFIMVIWNCYRYLVFRQASTQQTIHFIEPPMDDQSLLPDYKMATEKFPSPPPDYDTAVARDNQNSGSCLQGSLGLLLSPSSPQMLSPITNIPKNPNPSCTL